MSDYVRIENGKIAEGPGPCPKAVAHINGFHLLKPQEQREYGWYPFEAGAEPVADPRTHKVVWHLDIGQTVRSYATVEPLSDTEVEANLETLRKDFLARNADFRWQKEVGGVEFNGIPVHTDRDSQITIFAAALRGQDEMWKGRDGNWYPISAQELALLSESIATHKRICFQKEALVAIMIRGCHTFEDFDALDLEALWNSD